MKGNAQEGILEITSQSRTFPWVGQFQLEEERWGEAGISHTQPTTLRQATAQTLMQLLPSNDSDDKESLGMSPGDSAAWQCHSDFPFLGQAVFL